LSSMIRRRNGSRRGSATSQVEQAEGHHHGSLIRERPNNRVELGPNEGGVEGRSEHVVGAGRYDGQVRPVPAPAHDDLVGADGDRQGRCGRGIEAEHSFVITTGQLAADRGGEPQQVAHGRRVEPGSV
jgi:hypothetical protein